MKISTRERIIEEADYIIENNCTVRECAKAFLMSKSTIHLDVTDRLDNIDSVRFEIVKKVLQKNLSERHLRGGNATKKKYSCTKKR